MKERALPLDTLSATLPCEHQLLAPAGELSSWRTQGALGLLIFPSNWQQILQLGAECRRVGVAQMAILGKGTNVLIRDDARSSIALSLSRVEDYIHFDPLTQRVSVSANVTGPRLARYFARHGLLGAEFLVGIPGTLGGMARMNAGTGGEAGPCLHDLLHSVTVFDPIEGIRELGGRNLKADYRSISNFRNLLVLGLVLNPQGEGDAKFLQRELAEILRERHLRQPVRKRTAGSTFLPTGEGIPAGFLIDSCGLKGFRVGTACVSMTHANWIEADRGCRAEDIEMLIDEVTRRVRLERGIELQREVHYFPSEVAHLCFDPEARV